MSWLDQPIRVILIVLPIEARKTWRVLNGGHEELYPVKLGLSRPFNEYERRELSEFQIEQDGDNNMFVVVRDTTLEHIRDNIDEYHATFDSAAEKARRAKEQAMAEDKHLAELAKELTNKFRRDFGLDRPAE